jgi:hypothetical protein
MPEKYFSLWPEISFFLILQPNATYFKKFLLLHKENGNTPHVQGLEELI